MLTKNEYIFVYLEENAVQNYNTTTDNKFFKIMAEFKRLFFYTEWKTKVSVFENRC